MKRLLNPPIGGVPYANTDFVDILQEENKKAYSSYLEAINVGSYKDPRNRGIILQGLEILSSVGAIDIVLSMTNSLLFFDGEFYEPDPSLIGTDTFTPPVYFFPGLTQSDQRYLRDLTTSNNVTETNFFSASTSAPANGPYIKFESIIVRTSPSTLYNLGTSRYLRRILKYFTDRPGDIYMTKRGRVFQQGAQFPSQFSATGLGVNDMDGYILLNANAIQYSDRYVDTGGRIPQAFGAILEFMAPNAEQREFTTGSQSIRLTINDIPFHRHYTLPTTSNMSHKHGIHTTMNNWQALRRTNMIQYSAGVGDDNLFRTTAVNAGDFPYSSRGFDNLAGGGFPTSPTPLPKLDLANNLEKVAEKRLDGTDQYWINTEVMRVNQTLPDGSNGNPKKVLTSRVGRPYSSIDLDYPGPQNFALLPDVYKNVKQETSWIWGGSYEWESNFLTHSHTFTSGTDFGSGAVGATAQPHDNRPAYRVIAYYTKL